MNFRLPSPFGGHAVPLLAVLASLTWLLFIGGRRQRWVRRAAILVYLIALSLAVGECALWLAGLRR
jgi:hypothetical protein